MLKLHSNMAIRFLNFYKTIYKVKWYKYKISPSGASEPKLIEGGEGKRMRRNPI